MSGSRSGTSEESSTAAEPRPLIILADGSWCGREADTRSNIHLLANMVGIDVDDFNDTDVHCLGDKAWYMHGVGLGSTFLDYVFNGITAQDIEAQCVAAYRFIVDHYSYPDRQIWMFGLSRGAYMPVLKSDGSVDNAETDVLCRQVYRIYRSKDPMNDPHSDQSEQFRQHASWPLIGDEGDGEAKLLPPVKFLGLFDTVGSLGIPDFVGGVGLDWPRFHDQEVSTVVELVHHAMSLHDDFYIFTPCLATRSSRRYPDDTFGITQKWFPGVHYDLGRQRFKFLRMFGDLVLKWMLEAIKGNDPSGQVISTNRVDEEITAADQRIVSDSRQIGDGNVYRNIVAYAPFGSAIVGLLTGLFGTRWQTNQIHQLFFTLRDRLIADPDARVYRYLNADVSIVGSENQRIEELAEITPARYPSQTYQAWRLKRRLLGYHQV